MNLVFDLSKIEAQKKIKHRIFELEAGADIILEDDLKKVEVTNDNLEKTLEEIIRKKGFWVNFIGSFGYYDYLKVLDFSLMAINDSHEGESFTLIFKDKKICYKNC